ncbi:MAG: hypothetical protein GXN98_03220 [Euryarchaeota archaeon]|nr:hypothetical protein [Euryarchaeota archaeon]
MERETAVKLEVRDVVEGNFVRSGSKESNYVLTRQGVRAGRVRLMGLVVSKFVSEDGKFASITLDDGTATIAVRAFREIEPLMKLRVGDTADVIGKPREYEGEVYVLAECAWRVDDPNWELVRKLEIAIQKLSLPVQSHADEHAEAEAVAAPQVQVTAEEGIEELVEEESIEVVEEEVPEEAGEEADPKMLVLNLIEELDDGEGVKYITLLRESGLEEDTLESVLNELLGDGEIYEPKIGRFRRV